MKSNTITIDFSKLGIVGEIALEAAIEETRRQVSVDAKNGDIIAKNTRWALRNIKRQIKRQNPEFFED